MVKKERLNERWRKVCATANVVDLHLHDLRREFGSRLAKVAALHEVRDALGHSNVTMTNTYLGTQDGALTRVYNDLARGGPIATDGDKTPASS